LIYIKDYHSLNSLVAQHSSSTIQPVLDSLRGKTVTVFIEGGGASGNGFTGILIEVFSDRVTLITKLPNCNMHNCRNGGNRSCGNLLGTRTVIMIDAICAVIYME
jgi:hypothetical protein